MYCKPRACADGKYIHTLYTPLVHDFTYKKIEWQRSLASASANDAKAVQQAFSAKSTQYIRLERRKEPYDVAF